MSEAGHSRSTRAFSLVELLAVIAVLGVILAILIPASGWAFQSARMTQTQTQFQQYILAYEQFKATYGYYPDMQAEGAFSLSDNNERFIQVLSGRSSTGAAMDDAYALQANPRGKSFYTFTETDFSTTEEGEELTDAFGNPHIRVMIDRDGDGLIPVTEVGDLGAGAVESGQTHLRAGVVIYSANSTNNPDWRRVYSWR